MQLHPTKFALAAAATAALLFIACWLLVAALPGTATSATEHMLHVSMENIAWNMSPVDLCLGTLSWSLGTGAAAWLMATLYNRLCGAR